MYLNLLKTKFVPYFSTYVKSPTKKQNKVKSTPKLLKFDDPEQSYKYIINEFLSIGAMLICVYMKFALKYSKGDWQICLF